MPSISPGSTASSPAYQFLSQILSRRDFPYQEDVKFSIRQHLLNVVQHFPGLQARTAVFHHNDGTSCNLLQADGTIPMYYQDVKYNIPVTIWLLETFPRQAPLVFVTPTRDMIIRPRHPLVDPSGIVTVPYLQQWVFPRSNLVDLVQDLSLRFGQDPPLYSRPAGQPPPPPPPQQQQQFLGVNPVYSRPSSPVPGTSGSAHSSASSSGGLTTARPPYPPPYIQQQQQPQQPPPSTSPYTEDPAEVFRRNAINTLTERVRQDLFTFRRSFDVETDELATVEKKLNQRSELLNRYTEELHREKEALEQQLQVVLMNTDVLETWLKNNDKPSPTETVDIDSAFEPCDVLSKQMLDCSVNDLAIEDLLYALDKAVQEGVISSEAYLKAVRSLSREQFFYRALATKVRGAQMQSQVASMAARASSSSFR